MDWPNLDQYLSRTKTGRLKQLIRDIEIHIDVTLQVGELEALARRFTEARAAGIPAGEELAYLAGLAHLMYEHEEILIRSRDAYREHCRIEALRRKTRGRISQRREDLAGQLEALMPRIEAFIRSFRETCERWGIRFERGFPVVTVALIPPEPGEDLR